MKKIFAFDERVINGTVTASSSTVCFATRELAEKARSAAIDANRVPDELGIRYCCGDIKETTIYESEDEVPILNNSKKESHHQVRFRGKDRKNKEWLYGGLFHMPDGSPCIVNVIRNHAGKPVFDYKEVLPETVGQFTEMKDRYGFDIWEGDIISLNVCYDGTHSVVVYDAEHAMFALRYDDPYNPIIYGLYDCQEKELEVLGNIHDNPELLKQTD